MRKILLTSIIVLITHFLIAQNYSLYSDIPYDTISGVNPNFLSLDIYKPNNTIGLDPVVVYVHGGSWRAGDKDNVALKPEFYTSLGYIFISINYRLSPNPPDTTLINVVRFPEHPRNVATAISWIYNNIHNYGGDKHKIGLTGHSAGGHIAAVVATNQSFLDTCGIPNQIPCICMHDAAAYNVVRLIAIQNAYSFSIQNAMGNDPLLWDDASPAIQVRNNPELGSWVLFSQAQGVTLYDEATLMQDSLAANGYNVPHYPLALEHNEMNLYVGVKDSADFQQLLNDNTFLTPSPNAYAIALAYTNSVQSFFQNCFSNITTSLYDYNLNMADFLIFPNPTQNQVTLSNLPSDYSGIVSIYNTIGQLMFSEKKNGSQFSIETGQLKTGMYIVQVKTEKGEMVTRKFIKE